MRRGDIIADRFLLEHLAGAGGMGTVHRALDCETGTPVAVKLMSDTTPLAAERFGREARILAELDHPHIVRYVAHGFMPEGTPYLVMEWLEGESLADRLRRARLDDEEAVQLAGLVASALGAAHALGITHRDIKPWNLFLVRGRFDLVKVLDFGIAQRGGASLRITLPDTILGTPGYMAPEQARGDGHLVDARADVFSLGAVLFECLAGRPAFEGCNVMSILAKLLLQDVPRLADIRPELPVALSELVYRMLAKDPARRLPDGAAVAEAITALLPLGQRASRTTLRPPSSGEVLTGSEQRLLFVVAAMPPLPDLASRPRADSSTVTCGLPRDVIVAIRASVEPAGAHVHELANGALMLTLMGRGSPTDLAARAARCALRLRAHLPEGPIALVSGRAETRDKLPVGTLVDRAVRILQLPVPASEAPGAPRPILIDDVTRALLDVRFDVGTLAETILLRAEREIGRNVRTLLGKPTPYVGHGREQRMVHDLIEQSFTEPMVRAILVLGPNGIGKSRLRHEVVECLSENHPQAKVFLGRGDSISAGSAFSIIGSALRGAAHIGAGEPLQVRRDKLLDLLGAYLHGAERQHVAQFLGEIVGTPFPDEASTRLRAARQNAELMADQIREAFLLFAAALTRVHPLLLVLEDLHWGDAASLSLVDAALAELGEKPLSILALARTEVLERLPRSFTERRVHRIWLRELPRRDAEGLARHVLGAAVDPAVIARIVERAAGNAFYLEELIRAVAEGRGDALPETVLGMVEARLSALGGEARRVLRAASVFGEVSWEGGVRALCGVDPGAVPLREVLVELCDRELLVRRKESRFAGEVEYAFRHTLLREGSYAMLIERDRVLGHRRAGEWLESAGEQDPKILAEHFDRGGDAPRAIGHHVRAAEFALSAGDLEAAVDLAQRALALGAAGEVAAELWAIETEALSWSRSHKRAYQAALSAFKVAAPGSRSHCRALGGALRSALNLRNPRDVGDLLSRLLRAEPARDAILALAWAQSTAITSLLDHDPASAGLYLERLTQITEPVVERDPAVAAWTLHTRACWARSVEHDPFAALTRDQASVDRFQAVGDRRYLPYARMHVGLDYALLGAYERAEAELRAGLLAAREGSLPALLGNSFQAFLLLSRGAFDGALDTARFVVEEAEACAERFAGLSARLLLCEALLARRDIDEAQSELESEQLAVEAARAPVTHAWFLTVRAALCLAQGKGAEAVALSTEAFEVGEGRGARHFQSHAMLQLVHAEALATTGRMDEARAVLCAAKDEIIGSATRILDPELRQSFLERRPVHARILARYKAWGGEA